jgi:iron complex transport system ATP-binding protein
MVNVENPTKAQSGKFMKVKVDNVSWTIESQRIVDAIHLEIQSGEFVGVIGPNGSGKSSLLQMIYRLYHPTTGTIFLNERDIWSIGAKEVAQNEAVLPQESVSDFDFTVEEIVFMGRTPHKKLFDADTKDDDLIVKNALSRVGMESFAQRIFRTLSGGEKQRVLIARALAQQAKALVLDEPTNHLDIRSQLEILELLRSLKVTIIIALHDLNIAATYCDRLYLLQAGRVVAHGQPQEVLTPATIESAYGVKAEVEIRQPTGRLYIIFTPNSGGTIN